MCGRITSTTRGVKARLTGAQARVVGRVLEQHVAGPRRVLGQTEPSFHAFGHALAAEAWVAEDHDRVVVAGAYPEAQRALVHGVFFPESPIEGVKVDGIPA